jgi:hypothetical protein
MLKDSLTHINVMKSQDEEQEKKENFGYLKEFPKVPTVRIQYEGNEKRRKLVDCIEVLKDLTLLRDLDIYFG